MQHALMKLLELGIILAIISGLAYLNYRLLHRGGDDGNTRS